MMTGFNFRSFDLAFEKVVFHESKPKRKKKTERDRQKSSVRGSMFLKCLSFSVAILHNCTHPTFHGLNYVERMHRGAQLKHT